MIAPRARLVVAGAAAARLDVVRAWLDERAPSDEVLVVAAGWHAGDELVRTAAAASGARFGLRRTTLGALAVELALPGLAQEGLAPASALALEAIAARAVHRLLGAGSLSYFAPVAGLPGFPAAVARTVSELRDHGIDPAGLAAAARGGADLAALAAAIAAELLTAGLADRASVLGEATRAVAGAPSPVGVPLILLDLPLATPAEVTLARALASRAPLVLATAASGDVRAAERLEDILSITAERLDARPGDRSLDAVQRYLFEPSAPPRPTLDASVTLDSWPGEARESVEIARRLLDAARRGVPFDRMAVVLHAPVDYVAHLEEACRRAGVPLFFARGTMRPHPAGRALLALLACAADGLSASRFAEYVSLAQVPDPDGPADGVWVPPADERRPPPDVPAPEPVDGPMPHPEDVRVIAGTARAPWRWERVLVDAAVIGGRERWRRRLEGLAAEIAARRAGLDDADEARAALLDRQLTDLRHLQAVALPLIDRLAALPDRATWGEWLRHLRSLATAALREPESVLAALGELEPMAPVGPADLDEVQQVLRLRLRDLQLAPAGRRYGSVFVATPEGMRGLAFDVVCVPGLAEKLFPRKLVQDPLLSDVARRSIARELPTQTERVAEERLALRLAAGSATQTLVLSYPRLDVEQARPRVPSFYALEVLRAAEGALPGFAQLNERTREQSSTRLGWPAPDDAGAAIDEAEYDLALIAPLLQVDDATVAGAARYLLGANPHLARALRARWRRWSDKWTVADGLIRPGALARDALARHQLSARSYSPTALQHFAACPYRFLLQAVHRLAPREEATAIETLDPLTRGALVHDVQFEVLTALRAEGLLPLDAPRLPRALAVLDAAVTAVADAYAERLAPAIARVWDDGITGVRADLREWVRRAARDPSGWVPAHFELSFGVVDRERPLQDPASVDTPVPVAGGLSLRGSIDLVERHDDGTLRVTDHKTGRVRVSADFVVDGGEALQPLLYALATEQLLGAPVRSGRLYYCTADAGFAEREVTLDAEGRAAVTQVVATVGRALDGGFLPAAPEKDGCRYCDYRRVCGPWEETRWHRKPQHEPRIQELLALRRLP